MEHSQDSISLEISHQGVTGLLVFHQDIEKMIITLAILRDLRKPQQAVCLQGAQMVEVKLVISAACVSNDRHHFQLCIEEGRANLARDVA